MRCALFCKTAGVQTVPAGPPGLMGTSICGNIHSQVTTKKKPP